MSGMDIQNLSKLFGNVVALSGVNLHIPEGKFVCLLGPSGCGKTTLLRIAAGLEEPSSGRVLLNGNDLTRVPSHKRNFGMVFQSLALFPHLSIGENIAYAMKIRGADQSKLQERVAALLELVRLPAIQDRRINQLSGGQRQRVAIARALAIEPELFLLDEPLSALDARLREDMQVELRLLQQRLGITTIVVTHDQREAMTMADMVVVMSEGEVQQVGSPVEIYRKPANSFVADFLGAANLLEGNAEGEESVFLDRFGVTMNTGGHGYAKGASVVVSVRPEEMAIRPQGAVNGNAITGTVSFIRDVGSSVEINVDCNGQHILVVATPKDRPDISIGDVVSTEVPAHACVVMPS